MTVVIAKEICPKAEGAGVPTPGQIITGLAANLGKNFGPEAGQGDLVGRPKQINYLGAIAAAAC
jgi:hypothetical protein